jgi:Icc-related predicted phosphoesterase
MQEQMKQEQVKGETRRPAPKPPAQPASSTGGKPAQKAEKVRVAALGDLHMKEDAAGYYKDLFLELNDTADILCLAGDLTDFGKTHEAENLAEDLRHLKIPVVGVLGNHDYESGLPEEVARILRQGGLCMLGENAHIHRGVGFAGVKGFGGGFGRRMLGAFGEPSTKAFVQTTIDECHKLEIALRSLRTEKKIVVMHYSPIEETVMGEPEQIYAYLGCSRLAETIDRFDITAVVHGHAQRGTYRGKTPKGVPVFNVAAGIEKEGGKAYAILEV